MSSTSVVTLEFVDYVTMTVTVAVSTLVGFYHAFRVQKNSNTKQFLVTDKSLGFLPVVLSTVATAISAMSFQGYPLETYSYGVQFLLFSISCFTGIYVFNLLFIPVYFNLGFTSIFQYLEFRFSRKLRMITSVLYSIQLILISSCMTYAPALALNQVTGLDLWSSVISIGVVCMVYTALGGIKAVVWADVFQLIVIIVCIVVVAVKGFIDVGGTVPIYEANLDGKRLDFYVFSDPRVKDTIWTYLIGGFCFNVCNLTPNQLLIQRMISNPNVTRARWSLYLTAILWVLILWFFGLTGFVMYTKYKDCDPFLNGIISSRDQMVPLFAVETLSFVKGFPGIFVAAVLCATLSTFSSVLNVLSALTLTDYIKPIWKDMTEVQSLFCSKILVFVYGVICVAFVALAANMGGVVRAVFSIAGIYGGTLFTVFALGVLFPWSNHIGALCGFVVSLGLGLWMAIGSLIVSPEFPTAPMSTRGCSNSSSNTTVTAAAAAISNGTDVDLVESIAEFPTGEVGYLYTLSPLWYPAITAFVGITFGLVVSICTGVSNLEELDPRLISPSVERLIRSLPTKLRISLGYKSTEMKIRRQTDDDDIQYEKTKSAKEMEEIHQVKEPLYPPPNEIIRTTNCENSEKNRNSS